MNIVTRGWCYPPRLDMDKNKCKVQKLPLTKADIKSKGIGPWSLNSIHVLCLTPARHGVQGQTLLLQSQAQTQQSRMLQICQVGNSVADPGGGGSGAQAPPCPQDFFKIMQFSGNFKGKTPIFSKFRDQAPFGVQTLLGPPGQNPGFATSLILDPRLKLQRN